MLHTPAYTIGMSFPGWCFVLSRHDKGGDGHPAGICQTEKLALFLLNYWGIAIYPAKSVPIIQIGTLLNNKKSNNLKNIVKISQKPLDIQKSQC